MKNSLLKRIGAIFAVVFSVFSVFIGNTTTVFAVTGSAYDLFDETSVADDLIALDGFSVDDYPQMTLDELGGSPSVELFYCTEFCYNESNWYNDYYGLYLYVYNPTQVGVYEYGNYVDMATGYDELGEPIEYKNVKIDLLSVTTDKKMQNRFLKFKVNDESLLSRVKDYAASHGGKRRYDIAGLQLSFADDTLAYGVDNTIARTYYFSGYGKGMAEESKNESTLLSMYDDLYTIDLNVNHTYYRGDFNDDWIAQTLNTAYFSIPNEVFEQYGERLQKIKAEWYEYKTREIFVTSDKPVYNQLKPYIGQDIGVRNDDLRYRVFWEDDRRYAHVVGDRRSYGKCYNGFVDGDISNFWMGAYWGYATPVTRMDWLFYTGDVTMVDDYRISSEDLETYMLQYSKDRPWQSYIESGGVDKYASTLFSSKVDDGRKRGYNVQEFDADTRNSFLFDSTFNWREEFDNYPLLGAFFDIYSPIVVLDDIDTLSTMTADDFGKKYYVNKCDAKDVQKYCLTELNAGRKPVLFRFAQTDYYASAAVFDSKDKWGFGEVDGFVAQETVFLNFDVISLTFRNNDNEEKVLAVVANPTDVINALDPAPDLTVNKEWNFATFFEKVLIFVGVLAGVIVLYLIIRAIIKHFTA